MKNAISKPITRGLSIRAALLLLPLLAPCAQAQSPDIEMLPPTYAAGGVCGGGNQILVYSGNPTGGINCVPMAMNPTTGNFLNDLVVNEGGQAVEIDGNQVWETAGGNSLYFQYNNSSGNVVIGGASGATNNLIISHGQIAVNTSTPAATVDVNGELRVGNSGAGCSAANEGTLQYDAVNHIMDFCNGTSWTAFQTASTTTSYPFGGMYELETTVGGAVLSCKPNAYTGACTCPTGFTPTYSHWNNTGGANWQFNQYVCTSP